MLKVDVSGTQGISLPCTVIEILALISRIVQTVHPHIAKCTMLVLLTFSLQIRNEILASSALEIWPTPP